MRSVNLPNKRKLNAVIVRQAQPKGNGYCIWDTHTRGLALRVRASGRKVWMVVYRSAGRPQWYRIGDASTIGLADARVMASEVMLAVAKGSNPAAERRAKRSAGTFGDLAAIRRAAFEEAQQELGAGSASCRALRGYPLAQSSGRLDPLAAT
jgi:hypothetical protein